MRRHRNAKIIATLGPSTSSPDVIHALFVSGADVFRLNFSHGTQTEHADRIRIIRDLEKLTGRPIAIVADLQGPKLRLGKFIDDSIVLREGQTFRLDLDERPGDGERVSLPHKEVFAALRPGIDLLLDDGKIRLRTEACGANFAETRVKIGGPISNNKGVNVPDVILPISPFTDKDRADLIFALERDVDWVAPSFIQRPQDLLELRKMVDGRAAILTKLEKPAAIDFLDDIIELSDGIMVARGDLGVELPPEDVPSIQKKVVRSCRSAGKPVVVATQMLESMIHSPVPTRAEASDVASAIYDGADAVMLSGETAAGKFPIESVTIMDRIIARVEKDPHYRTVIDAGQPAPQPTAADAVCDALQRIVHTMPIAATVTYTSSGFSSLRAARERPEAPILSLTPSQHTARRLSLVWGIHSLPSNEIKGVPEMVDNACQAALREGFANVGQAVVIMAGMPFGVSGTTNLLHIALIEEAHGAFPPATTTS